MIKPEKIIVVGGNAAGPAAAAKAKRVSPESEVIMIEAGEYISTGTCEIPYVLSGEIDDPATIVHFSASSFKEKKKVEVFTRHLVEAINSRERNLSVRNLNDGKTVTFDYSKLILATGSTVKVPDFIAGAYDNVFTLKSVTDLKKIRSFIRTEKPKAVCVVGAGYIGLEAAEALRNNEFEVTIIESREIPLPSAETEIGYLIKELLSKNKIEFYGGLSKLKTNISETGNRIKSIEIDGRILEFDFYISAAGFAPSTGLAPAARIQLGASGAIKVDSRLNTSVNNIYAAGDSIEVINAVTGKPEYMPLAALAHEYGHIAGENAAGGNLRAEPAVKNISVKIFGKYFASAGLSSAEASAHKFGYETVYAVTPNLVEVMPGSANTFGKIIFEKSSRRILGASFFGGKEVSGYSDLISMMIRNKLDARQLAKNNYNYTPPLSPFVNLLSVLGRKIK